MISQVLGGAAAAALNYAAFSGGIAAMEASSKIVRGALATWQCCCQLLPTVQHTHRHSVETSPRRATP